MPRLVVHERYLRVASPDMQVTVAAAATKDASCAANTWEIFDEHAKGLDQGVVDDRVFGGAGSKTETGGEETPVQRQARELATVILARWANAQQRIRLEAQSRMARIG